MVTKAPKTTTAAKTPAKTASAPEAKRTTKPPVKPVAQAAAPAAKSSIAKKATADSVSKAVKAAAAPAKKTGKSADKVTATPPRAIAEKVRVKLVRDSFAMPEADFALIDQLKARAMAAKRHAKKSELLRAGLQALAALTPAQLLKALDSLAQVKTGRPKKGN